MKTYLTKAVLAYVVASFAIGAASFAVALAPLLLMALVVRYGRKGSTATKGATLKAASYLYGRRKVYAHRVIASALFVAYPAIFLFEAIRSESKNVGRDMRDLRDAFAGRFAQ